MNSTSARVASIGENSTSSHSVRAWATDARARPLTSSRVDCSWWRMWMSEVETNVWMRGRCAVAYGLPGPVDVGRIGARQSGDHGAFDLPGDRLHGLEVARRGDREAGLDDVHAQARELLGDLELLRRVQRDAGRLLAVAQRGVEDEDAVWLGGHVGGAPVWFSDFGLFVLEMRLRGRHALFPPEGEELKSKSEPARHARVSLAHASASDQHHLADVASLRDEAVRFARA